MGVGNLRQTGWIAPRCAPNLGLDWLRGSSKTLSDDGAFCQPHLQATIRPTRIRISGQSHIESRSEVHQLGLPPVLSDCFIFIPIFTHRQTYASSHISTYSNLFTNTFVGRLCLLHSLTLDLSPLCFKIQSAHFLGL